MKWHGFLAALCNHLGTIVLGHIWMPLSTSWSSIIITPLESPIGQTAGYTADESSIWHYIAEERTDMHSMRIITKTCLTMPSHDQAGSSAIALMSLTIRYGCMYYGGNSSGCKDTMAIDNGNRLPVF